jgi:hypothetical protein
LFIPLFGAQPVIAFFKKPVGHYEVLVDEYAPRVSRIKITRKDKPQPKAPIRIVVERLGLEILSIPVQVRGRVIEGPIMPS